MKNNLQYAIVKIENACMPPESEKKSILKPSAKESNRKVNLFFFNGYKKTKMMYK
tara:strand:+ start:100 stop:264 length:165 start_codon:yes stop_codon:yes gene_type:complete